jgi:hypothetical protein
MRLFCGDYLQMTHFLCKKFIFDILIKCLYKTSTLLTREIFMRGSSLKSAAAIFTFAAIAGAGVPVHFAQAEEGGVRTQDNRALESSPLVPILRRGDLADVVEGLKNLMNNERFANMGEEELVGMAYGFGHAAKNRIELAGEALESLNQLYEKTKNGGTVYVAKKILENMAETAYADEKLTGRVLTLLRSIIESDARAPIRRQAVEHAGFLGDSRRDRPDNAAEALAAINQAASDSDIKIRQEVAYWNGYLNIKSVGKVQDMAIATLSVLLKDQDKVVRRQAVNSISHVMIHEERVEEVQRLLTPLLQDEDAEVREAAEENIKQAKENMEFRSGHRGSETRPAPR